MFNKLLLLLLVCIAGYSHSQAPENNVNHFNQNLEDYYFDLTGEQAVFHYDTILYNVYDSKVKFHVRNTTKEDISIHSIRCSDGSILVRGWSPSHGDIIPPDSSITIKISATDRPGSIRRTVDIAYYKDTTLHHAQVYIRGYIMNMKYVIERYEDPKNPTVVSPDNVIGRGNTPVEGYQPFTYAEGCLWHDYSLKSNNQSLYLNRQYNFPSDYLFKITNDTGEDIVLDNVKGTNYQIVFFVKTGEEWTYIKPAKATIPSNGVFYVKGLNFLYGKPNKIDTRIQINYHIGKKSFQKEIPVSGIVDFEKRKPIEKEVKPKPEQRLPHRPDPRPEGISRFGEVNLYHLEQGKKEYQFTLDEMKYHPSYGIPVPRRTPDALLWDTVIPGTIGKMKFSFTNLAEKPIYILDISKGGRGINYKLLSGNVIKPNESLNIEVSVDTFIREHNYEQLEISYYYNGKKYNYSLKQYAYQPPVYKRNGRSIKNNPIDTLKFIVVNSDNQSVNTYKLKIRRNGKIEMPEIQKINNEYCFNVPRDSKDTLYYELIDPKLGITSKGKVSREYDHQIMYLGENTALHGPHTYNFGIGPYKYEVEKDVYFIESANKAYSLDQVEEYLESLGLNVSNTCSTGMKYIKYKGDINELQNKLWRSTYMIRLLPVIHHSSLNQQGWGGACEWYSNYFEVSFYSNVADERIKAIFNELNIKQYKEGKGRDGDKLYKFSIDIIIDLKYVKTLDKLWNLPEVSMVGQSHHIASGLD